MQNDEHLIAGNAFSREMLAQVMPHIESLDMEDRLLWWAGFYSHISGVMGASIGVEAFQAVHKTIAPILASVAKDETKP